MGEQDVGAQELLQTMQQGFLTVRSGLATLTAKVDSLERKVGGLSAEGTVPSRQELLQRVLDACRNLRVLGPGARALPPKG